jgi:hypothetical protein
MIDWSSINMLGLSLIWALVFAIALTLFRGFYNSIFDPLCLHLFYISAISAPVFYFAIFSDIAGSYSFFAAAMLTVYIAGLYLYLARFKLSLSRFSSAIIVRDPASLRVSLALRLILLAASIATIYLSIRNISELSNSGGFFLSRYAELQNGRSPVLAIIKILGTPVHYFFLGLLFFSIQGEFRLSNSKGCGRFFDFLLILNVFALSLSLISSFLSGSRSFLVSFVVSFGASLSFFQWIYYSKKIQRYTYGLVLFAAISLGVAVIAESLFLVTVSQSSTSDLSSGFESILIRLFSSADGFIIQESTKAYFLFDDNNPLRFVVGPFGFLLGIKNSTSFGNLVFNLVRTQDFNSGSNYNILHSSFSYGFFAFPLFLFLILSWVASLRYVSLYKAFGSRLKSQYYPLALDGTTLASFILFTEVFSIVEDLEYAFFKFAILVFGISACFMLRYLFGLALKL